MHTELLRTLQWTGQNICACDLLGAHRQRRGRSEQTDRPRPGDQYPLALDPARDVDRVQNNRERLRQCRPLQGEALREHPDHVFLDDEVFAHAALRVGPCRCAAEVASTRPQVTPVLDTWLGITEGCRMDRHRGPRHEVTRWVEVHSAGDLVSRDERLPDDVLAVRTVEEIVDVRPTDPCIRHTQADLAFARLRGGNLVLRDPHLAMDGQGLHESTSLRRCCMGK